MNDEMQKQEVLRKKLLERLDDAQKLIEANNQKIENGTESAEELMNNLNDRNWPNFLSEFELVFPQFFPRLNELSEGLLSKNERRLCCLIKLNLSNKEIAEYVFVSPESVKKAKNRLFKKLKLNESESAVSAKIRNL